MDELKLSITDLEHKIAEKIYVKIEKWNLYLGDAGLARALAIECVRNIDYGNSAAAKKSLDSIHVKIGDGIESISLSRFITSQQINDLEDILNEIII